MSLAPTRLQNQDNPYIDDDRQKNIASKQWRARRAGITNNELQAQFQEALKGGAMPGSLPTVPDVGSSERKSKYDSEGAKRRMNQIVPGSSANAEAATRATLGQPDPAQPQGGAFTGAPAPRPAFNGFQSAGAAAAKVGSAVASAVNPAFGLFGGFQPGDKAAAATPATAPAQRISPEFASLPIGSTKQTPTGAQSFQPDSHGGRWVGTGGVRPAVPAAQSGLSTVIPQRDLGGGFSSLPLTNSTPTPGDPVSRPIPSVAEYDPRMDPKRGTALTYTDANGQPTGATGRMVPKQYQTPVDQIGKGEIVGSGKTAPLQAEGVLTPSKAPAPANTTAPAADPWESLRDQYPGVFKEGHDHNAVFRHAWGQQQTDQGLDRTAHPTPEQAAGLLKTLFPADSPTAATTPAPSPASAHDDITSGSADPATAAGLKVGSAIVNAPQVLGGFADSAVGDPIRSGAAGARTAADNAFNGFQAGVTGTTPDAVRTARNVDNSQSSIGKAGANWQQNGLYGQQPTPAGPTVTPPVPVPPAIPPSFSMMPTPGAGAPMLPKPAFAGFQTPLGRTSTTEDMPDAFAHNDQEDAFRKRLGSSAYSDGQ